MNKEKHEFALFVELLSVLLQKIVPDTVFIITDEKLFHRITTVLRAHLDQECIVFDRILYAYCTIVALSGKKQIHMKLKSKHFTHTFNPSITFLLPMLKKDDYEGALYSLVETGVTTVQLVITRKTHTSWSSERDMDRAQRIFIAAAEQSKNYCFPLLKAPVLLEQALHALQSNSTNIFFDPTGKPCFSVMRELYDNQPQDVVLLIGPEGDLSNEEKKMIKEKNFIFCALTPTVLRSTQAAALSAGLVRSLLTMPFL